jgi:hypothetical protein
MFHFFLGMGWDWVRLVCRPLSGLFVSAPIYRWVWQCHFDHHKYHMTWPGLEPVSPSLSSTAVSWERFLTVEIPQLPRSLICRLTTVSQLNSLNSVSLILRPTVSRPVCLGIKPPSRAYDQIFPLSDHCGFFIWGALSDERTGLSFSMYNIQYILLSQIWDQVPVFISPRDRVARLYPQALGSLSIRPGALVIWPRGGPNRKHRLQRPLYFCHGRLPTDSSVIVDVFTGRYQATHVPSRDRCIATVIHATILHRIGLQAYTSFCSYFAKRTRFKNKFSHPITSQASGQKDEPPQLRDGLAMVTSTSGGCDGWVNSKRF